MSGEGPSVEDVLHTQMGVPMEFLTTEELLSEFEKRGHNYVLIFADSTLENEPSNGRVEYIPDGTAVDEDNSDARTTSGPWLLWALAQAFVTLYEKNMEWYDAGDGSLTPKARVNNRLRRIYNECESLLDSTPSPFEEPES